MNSMLLCDGYKVDHRRQYPENTTLVYSNFTPRSDNYAPTKSGYVVNFGLQYFIKKYLIEDFKINFFNKPKEEVIKSFTRRINNYLGPNEVGTKHIEALHDLGYLPIEIKALPEGSKSFIRIPNLTIKNTLPEFFWVTNFLETLMSCILWQPMTSATIAHEYWKEFKRHSELTGSPEDFIQWQGHDFSFRGMPGLEAAMMSGAGHLLSFTGTDTIPAIDFLEQYYNADSDKELIGGSVPATEHSVMCMGTFEDEIGTFKRLITEIYPSGVVSIVSDTWDFWKVMAEYLPTLKEEILARDGRLVIRPDSGDPVKIICGLNTYYYGTRKGVNDNNDCNITEFEWKGAYELLWDIFGGTINDKGYKVLNPKIGLIYGDSITLDRQKEILAKLELKGFTVSNLVLGIGSFTYTYNTRDSYGTAMKATYGEVDGIGRKIFKDPITDNGMKKSAKGLLQVKNGVLKDQCSWDEEQDSDLKTVFKDGILIKDFTLQEIRNNLKEV